MALFPHIWSVRQIWRLASVFYCSNRIWRWKSFCWASKLLSVVFLPRDMDAVLKTLAWLCSQNPWMVAWESVHGREKGDLGLLRSNPASIQKLCGRSLGALSTVSFPVFSNCSLQARGVAPGSDANPGSSVPTGSRVLTFSAACGSPAPGNSSKLMSWKHCGFSSVLQEYPQYLLNLSKLSTVRFFFPPNVKKLVCCQNSDILLSY